MLQIRIVVLSTACAGLSLAACTASTDVPDTESVEAEQKGGTCRGPRCGKTDPCKEFEDIDCQYSLICEEERGHNLANCRAMQEEEAKAEAVRKVERSRQTCWKKSECSRLKGHYKYGACYKKDEIGSDTYDLEPAPSKEEYQCP